MAWTQAQLDDLEAAIATGVLSVGHGDKRVTYRSQAEMLRLRVVMRQVLGLSTPPKCGVVRMTKGIE